jgi:archaellin
VLIYNREDLNRALTEAYKNPTRISVLKLAADIVLTADMQINQSNVTIDGGNLYGFTASALLYTITSYADLTLINLNNNNVNFKILNLPFKIDNCTFSTDTLELTGIFAIDISIDNALTTIRPIIINNTTIHNFSIPLYVQPVAGSEFIHLSAEDITVTTDTAAALTIYTRCSATIDKLKYLSLLNPVPDSQLIISATRRLILANSLISQVLLNQVTCTNSLVCNNRFVDGIGTTSYGSFAGSNSNRFVNNSGVITKTFAANDLDLDSSLPSAGSQINVDAAAAPVAGYVLTATSPTTATWQPAGGGGGGTFGTANVTFSRSVHSVTTTILDAGVAALSNILVSIGIPSTRDIDEMEMAPVIAAVGTIVPGVSFDVIAVSIDGDADGIYNIKYTRD